MILITGCARSGTSLTTKVIQTCGASLGNTKVNALNENTGVRENVVKPYLRSIGADPLGQRPLPDLNKVKPVPGFRDQVLDQMGRPQEPWAYKGAKLCLFWPVWADAFPEAKYVIVRRDMNKIAESCLRTSFMRGYQDKAGWLDWIAYHLDRFEEMKAHLDVVEVWPGSSDTWMRDMIDAVGLQWNDAAESVFNAGKWHG